jgi:extracellular elastinolytic metalloproteinase
LEPRLLLSETTGLSPTVPYLPPQHWLISQNGYLTEPSAAQPLDIAKAYLVSHADELGLRPQDLLASVVTNQYTSADTGVTHIYLRQQYNGLEVANANLSVSITSDGRVLSVGGGFVAGLGDGQGTVHSAALPELTALDALARAGRHLGLTWTAPTLVSSLAEEMAAATVLTNMELSLDSIPARLQYVATPRGAELAWNVVVRTPDRQHWYDVSVDASTGAGLLVNDWVDGASYEVFAFGAESPDDGQRSLVTDPNDKAASPYGWHDTDGVAGAEYTDTRGNNVSAQEDWDYDNSGGTRPDGGPELVFDFPLDLAQDPRAYVSAAVTNLFYWNNLLHDIHYVYGFDEAAGNFQVTNYTGLGLGDDAVQADAQDGGDANNANFATPPDGYAPRMQMYEFTYSTPNRDADLDNAVIVHEYGHGVSNRLVGGPANVNALSARQSRGMGEGWSDWWGLMLTMEPTDTKMASYPVGTYVLGEPPTGTGIRRYPYSYDMAVDPLTMGAYNSSDEAHNVGEIWCSALWDMTWLLIDAHGYGTDIAHGYDPDTPGRKGGNNLALKLVMDSLKLMPANPTFLQARDAILLADTLLTGGANQLPIWTAFSRRGFGGSAYAGADANATTVKEAFDIANPDPMVISSTPSGPTGMPVNAVTFTFNEAINPASFNWVDDVASFTGPGGVDLKPQITGASWSNGDRTLQISFNSQTAPGVYAMAIGPQILAADNGHPMNQDLDRNPGEVSGDSYTMSFHGAASVYQADMSADPGWTLDAGTALYRWQYGAPTGSAGDPASGHTGPNVVGYNLNGAYPNSMSATQYATTPAFSTSGYTDLKLGFWRWLGAESSSYDRACVEVWDGTSWTTIWDHVDKSLSDTAWRYEEYALPASAGNRAAVKIRWGMGPTDSSVTYCGWNLDDVLVVGVRLSSLSVTIDQAPGQADPTSGAPVGFRVVFDKPVTDFADDDVTLSGTAPGKLVATVSGSGTTYNVAVSGMTGTGTVIATLDAAVAHDADGNPNNASTSADNVITYDVTAPTVAINQAIEQLDPTGDPWINFTVVFDETVTDFATGDVTLGGTAPGTLVGTVTGSGTTYNVAVSGMTGTGTVVATLGAGVAHDASGHPNDPSTSTDNVVTYGVAAPTVLTATLQAGPRVSLAWVDNATNETGFVVQRSDNGGPFATIAMPAAKAGTGNATYVDAAAMPGNAYVYQVAAVNVLVTSAFSNTAGVALPALPAAPTGLAATAQSGSPVSLAWTDNATSETGFVVQRSSNGGPFATIATPAANAGTGKVTYADSTAQPGIAYVYQVCAMNGPFVASVFSNTASAIVPAPPAAPTVLTASLQAGPQVGLTWIDNATNETGFVVQRSDSGGPFATIATPTAKAGTGAVTYADVTAQPGKAYAYRVSAANGTSTSAFSSTASVTVPAAPAAPTGLTATLQAASGTPPRIRLTFWDNAANETGFVVERSVNGGVFAQLVALGRRGNTGDVIWTDTVTAGNTYAYRVRAMNGVVPSAYSSIAPANGLVVPPAPSSPLNLTGTPTQTGATARIDLAWTDNSDNETQFIIQRSATATFPSASTTTFTVSRTATQSGGVGGPVTLRNTGLQRGVTYYYRILARNLYGDSTWVYLSLTTP